MWIIKARVYLVCAILLIGKLEHLHHIHVLIAQQSCITVEYVILSSQFINICRVNHSVHIANVGSNLLPTFTPVALLVLFLLLFVLFIFFMRL